jgi:hypothetical protein
MAKLTYWEAASCRESLHSIYSKTKRGARLELEALDAKKELWTSKDFMPVCKQTVIYIDAFDLLTKALRGEI